MLHGMSDRLRHRGPDGSGVLWHEGDRIGLAHRRLAVVDLSEAGSQPMVSDSDRFAMIFNGEVVNAPSLSAALTRGGWRPRGHSDTEVMLAAIEAWGLAHAVARFAGMFAFALHDRADHALYLVRDRLGIKPLHWTSIKAGSEPMVAFASELRALVAVPGFSRRVDTAAVTDVLTHACVRGTRCIWSGVSKVPPGHWIRVDLGSGAIRLHCHWNALDVATRGCVEPLGGPDAEVVEKAGDLLDTVIREHLVSDVPVGCLLSGGLDSTAVAAIAGQHATGLHAFTLGMREPQFDERPLASRTAAALGMRLDTLDAGEQDLLACVQGMPKIFDEPLADSGLMPMLLVSRLARDHATVTLSGDGGDEVFAGYNRHVSAVTHGNRAASLRRGLAFAAGLLSVDAWNTIGSSIWPMLPRGARMRELGDKLAKWRRMHGTLDEAIAYESLVSLGSGSGGCIRSGAPTVGSWWNADAARALPDFLRRMQFMDQTGYLVDDVLVKVDRASMAHGLEVRVPLLDHRIVEFAWRLPARMKVRGGRGKWLLREVLRSRAPLAVPTAAKSGFAIPLGRWLRGPLRDWAADLLSSSEVRDSPLVDAAAVHRSWSNLLAGSDVPQHQLWAVLTVAAWSRHWSEAP